MLNIKSDIFSYFIDSDYLSNSNYIIITLVLREIDK